MLKLIKAIPSWLTALFAGVITFAIIANASSNLLVSLGAGIVLAAMTFVVVRMEKESDND